MTDPRIERLTEMVAALRQEGYNRQESIELLYARIEALEAAQQQPQQPAGTDHAGWHRLSDVKPLNGAQCLFRVHPNLLHSRGVWVDQSHSLTPSISPSGFYTDLGLFVGDPERISWRLAMPHEIPPQQPAVHIPDARKMVDTGWRNLHDLSPIMEPAPAAKESSATAPPAPDDRLRWCPTHGQQPRNAWGCPECVRELRDAAAPPAPADVVMSEASRSSMEVRDYLDSIKVYGSTSAAPPAPAGGLVELIRDELGHHGTASASAVIRTVAAWLRSELISRAVADRLDQEANR